MRPRSILAFIKKLKRPVFTTHELSAISARSPSVVTQALNNLVRDGFVDKIYRGIWAEKGERPISPYAIVPFLFPRARAYVSFLSALHLYGIIEQIPQVITLASTTHARTIKTKIGAFHVHRISPSFFTGFKWYREEGDFLIAEPEKALIDSLYISAYKNKRFSHFPELRFPKTFSARKTMAWVGKIPTPKTRVCVVEKLQSLLRQNQINI